MINIAICDDDEPCLAEIAKEIAKAFPPGENRYTITRFASGSELLSSGEHDVVFLDVEMDGMNGIETAHRLRERGDKCKLIFLTAHEKYALPAFDVEASGYLLKPVNPQKLSALLHKIASEQQIATSHFITVKQGANSVSLKAKDIQYIEVFDRKLFVHTALQTYDFYEKLERIEKEFSGDFFRCHRSYLVNFAYVKRYDKVSITLNNDEIVLISKRKYGEFCQSFLAFLKKGGGV